MSLLLKIVKDFEDNLLPYKYKIELENKEIIEFYFKKNGLKHLLGIQKTIFDNLNADLVYKQISEEILTFNKLKKQKHFSDIETRILNFSRIKDLLNLKPGDEIIKFDKSLLKNCTLNSKYIIHNDKTGETLHLGLAKDSNGYYPETWFVRNSKSPDKYIKGQEKIKIEKIEKIEK